MTVNQLITELTRLSEKDRQRELTILQPDIRSSHSDERRCLIRSIECPLGIDDPELSVYLHITSQQ